jgi:GGDEF domain-containing protein
MYHAHPSTTCPDCQAKDAENARLREKYRRATWEAELSMPNRAGLFDIIHDLPNTTTYTIVLCDIDRLKDINKVTGNHIQTNHYLRAGLAVRKGEIIGQLYGDEFLAIIDEHSADHSAPATPERRHTDSADAFVARIARQLAGQPLTISERYALAGAQGCSLDQARLSATFATQSGVSAGQVQRAIEALSCDVLRLKAERDMTVRVL